jgi:hypothetical protein
MQKILAKLTIATATFVCATLLSPGSSERGGLSLSIDQAHAARLYVSRHAGPYYAYDGGLPWYAVRAYYARGPWTGTNYSYGGWSDYATRNGIGCVPGTVIKGGDGILYLCQ